MMGSDARTALDERVQAFCGRFRLRLPILLAPMAGACPVALSVEVAKAGGSGACGALPMKPEEMVTWANDFRSATGGPFQMNLWIPDAAPVRDAVHEAKLRGFLERWGPAVPEDAGDAVPLDFELQCEALLEIAPPVVSSVMGMYPAPFVHRLKERGVAWWANVSTVAEARAAAEAGAQAVVVQGMEAGGHRGSFDAGRAEHGMVGLFSLLPAVADAVSIPVVATGGIADGRGVTAALMLGASAVQIGTGFLRSPEAAIHPAWANSLARTAPEDTVVTRAFSGRAGRSIATDYALAAAGPGAPVPASYPVQRGLTQGMRAAAVRHGDVQRMQAWAGQSAALARAEPAGHIVRRIWKEAVDLLA